MENKCSGDQSELIIIGKKSRTIQADEARFSMLVTAIQLLVFYMCLLLRVVLVW